MLVIDFPDVLLASGPIYMYSTSCILDSSVHIYTVYIFVLVNSSFQNGSVLLHVYLHSTFKYVQVCTNYILVSIVHSTQMPQM
jgi:hypothetical protein